MSARHCYHLHDYGIVHADIKPSNIIMDPSGNGVLSNFEGLAFADQEARFSDIEVGYSSPESVASERVDRASDVYSLGASLYQTLVGEFAWLDEDGEPRNQTENDVIPTLPVQHAVFQRILHRLLTFDPSGGGPKICSNCGTAFWTCESHSRARV